MPAEHRQEVCVYPRKDLLWAIMACGSTCVKFNIQVNLTSMACASLVTTINNNTRVLQWTDLDLAKPDTHQIHTTRTGLAAGRLAADAHPTVSGRRAL